MLTVKTPAQDRALVTPEELQTALGMGAPAAAVLAGRVSDVIARACNLPHDGINPPSLRQEVIVETIRLDAPRARLILSRFPVAEVVAVSLAGVELTAHDHELHGAEGVLVRLVSDHPTPWPCGKIVVEYKAGFDTIPHDLKLAATKLAAMYASQEGRDPMVRSEEIPGVLTTSFWVGSIGDGALPPEVMDLLSPYRHRRAGT